MGRIEGEPALTRPSCPQEASRRPSGRTTSPHRESGLTSLGCSVTREPRLTDSGRQADVGGSNARWCGSPTGARLALHRLEEGRTYDPSAPGAYREGRCKATASREGRL